MCRTATKEDYPAMRRLWDAVRTGEDYAFAAMTDAELEEMERFGRGIVIVDPAGSICAESLYLKKKQNCYSYIGATNRLGLAGWAAYEKYLRACEEGCIANVIWIREDNIKAKSLSGHLAAPTGKFFCQFVCRARKRE